MVSEISRWADARGHPLTFAQEAFVDEIAAKAKQDFLRCHLQADHQNESAVTQTISRALYEEVTFDSANVTSLDWKSYPDAPAPAGWPRSERASWRAVEVLSASYQNVKTILTLLAFAALLGW